MNDYLQAENPHFLGGTLLSLIMAWTGNMFHEINIHLAMPLFLHFVLSCAKVFCYIGSGLVGFISLWRFLQKMNK
jgi:hypothetical protein